MHRAWYPRALFQKATTRLAVSNLLTPGSTPSKLPTSGLYTGMLQTPGDVQNSPAELDPCGLLMSGFATNMIRYLPINMHQQNFLPHQLTVDKIPNAGLPQNPKPQELWAPRTLTTHLLSYKATVISHYPRSSLTWTHAKQAHYPGTWCKWNPYPKIV